MKHSNIKCIYGNEPYLMEREERRFLTVCQQRAGEAPEQTVFEKDVPVATVVEAFQASSLFGGSGLVIWKDCPLLPIKHGGRSRSKLTKEETWFLAQMENMPETNGLLFITKLPKETSKLDTGCVFFKELSKLADVAECHLVDNKSVMTYVNDYLAQHNLSLTSRGDRYLRALFQTWETIPLMYVFSELDKLQIMLPDGTKQIDAKDLTSLFAGSMEKNLFAFTDYFLQRDGTHTLPFVDGLFAKQDAFLKNTGYVITRLRLLRAYKELLAAHCPPRQCDEILTGVNRGKSVKYALYSLKKVISYWKIEELDELISQIFTLQLNIRRGMAAPIDMEQLICLYCQHKGRA